MSAITVKIPTDKKQELKTLSEKSGIQMGSLIRRAIYELLEKEKEKDQ